MIEKTANELKIPSYRISAKTGDGIHNVFTSIIDHIAENQRKEKDHEVIV